MTVNLILLYVFLLLTYHQLQAVVRFIFLYQLRNGFVASIQENTVYQNAIMPRVVLYFLFC